MTLTKEVQNQLFSAETNKLICLPPRSAYTIPLPPSAGPISTSPSTGNNGAPWTEDEHARFLLGLEMFPSGPWKAIASIVGSRTARQTMSHAQKYRQKIARRQRGARLTPTEPQVATHRSAAAATAAEVDDTEQELLQQRLEQQHISAVASTESFQSAHSQAPSQQHNNNSSSPVSTLMTESLSEMHLTSEQIDEILQSLFPDDTDESLVITSEDMEALMVPKLQ